MRRLLTFLLVVAGALAALAYSGHLPKPLADEVDRLIGKDRPKLLAKKSGPRVELAPPIAVTVARVEKAKFSEAVSVTGSLAARNEIIVGPEIEGVRVVELFADEGDTVRKGQPLARLVSDVLDAQLAQNDALRAKGEAAIAQARSQIAQADARLAEAKAAFERARPLRGSGTISESVFEQREAAARTAEAQKAAAVDGLRLAEAELAQIAAQRRELEWRRSRTTVVSPAEGVIARRLTKIGAMGVGAGEPMFRIIANGEIELEAEVPEFQLGKLKEGQAVRVSVAGVGDVDGKIRLVAPEVDRASRLGRVKVFLGVDPRLRIGAFARARIETASSEGLAVPTAAVLYLEDSAHVQVVIDNKIISRKVRIGLASGGLTEVTEGIAAGDVVVAKAGTFLRDGDVVRPFNAPMTSASGG
jgi:RND family efflux transporter MFP subunit